MNQLISTYRIQFHKDFTFSDFEKILPYLVKMGAGTVYASPIFESVPGSTHGYDGLNPNRINPEIGTIEELNAISNQLNKAKVKWLQDIVPNHMAFDHRNPWLMDVLEKGPQSAYATFFDIMWKGGLNHGRIMVPFLGATADEVFENGELRIAYEHQHFVFKYSDVTWPLRPLSYAFILQIESEAPTAIRNLVAQIPETEADEVDAVHWEEIRLRLAGLFKNESIGDYVQQCIDKINGDKIALKKIEAQQFYHLCHWNETDKQINYRRFFTVNGLICLNIQDPTVFEKYHELIKTLLHHGVFHGLRIDHVDGLYDPTEYLERLRVMAGDEVPIVVEKILEPGEPLSEQWPIQGNTGYDFLSLVNNLFTNPEAEELFTKFYRQLVKSPKTISELVHEKKSYILNNHMRGELDNLFQLLIGLDLVEKKFFATIRNEDMKEAIGAFLVHCPVYRFYGSGFPLNEEEGSAVYTILENIKKSNSDLRRAVDVLEKILLKIPLEDDESVNNRIAHFYKRCMQFTGPLMAKGVEDTLMYTYQRFIGHNEVGDAPSSFGISVDEFHSAMVERQHKWPNTLNATSTHDTKRGEDVRARLNVLTDIPTRWLHLVKEWQAIHADIKTAHAPDDNDEYFIYQTLVGAAPVEGITADEFPDRINSFLQKALREAKTHSTWAKPNEAYESGVAAFVSTLMNASSPFRKSFDDFQKEIVDHGIINSISQVILKFTCPGIPDVYQGCELWDFSLVDPDNRRPVDYVRRQQLLEASLERQDFKEFWDNRHNGQIKQWFVYVLFRLRRQCPELFSAGEYIPLPVHGTYKDHILAFARRFRQQLVVVVVPLHSAIICKEQNVDPLSINWRDTAIHLPEGIASEWVHVLNNETHPFKSVVRVAELFQDVPFAVIKGKRLLNQRGAGILLHISSLPSDFGIGDLGPGAREFVDFLLRSRQKYWQLLPLNPIEAAQSYSPYSSISSRAGNTLFISPQLLVQDGFLDAESLQKYFLPHRSIIDFDEAERVKLEIFDSAWNNYKQGDGAHLKKEFDAFCQHESEWLQDFAIYSFLKQLNDGKPWYEWNDDLKQRDKNTLQHVQTANKDEIEKIMWLQFIFSRQWKQLKKYCNEMGICLIGDLPFYVSYDSADVWAHTRYFALDENGNSMGMAGCPPDSFSADGQLWGMPVFKWNVLQKEKYTWWIERLRKNIELFDIVRLDHFRAFSAYWEVPAGDSTAKNGTWKSGPGADFFETVKKSLGELPFVAEDLGEIDEPVYQLRDQFRMPGMKVLQFAFGGGVSTSIHSPHNYEKNFIVYTGTHDNNTTRGWFNKEADEQAKLEVELYAGRPVSAAEVSMILCRMAYSSVATTVIIPLQDVLNLDETARMNKPASIKHNWSWRLLPGQINDVAEENLRRWTSLYNRD